MTNSKLAAGGIADAARLRGIANTTDLHTRAVLSALYAQGASGPVWPGRSLDIGAGTGTVARWVAETWPGGQVTALDRDAAPLRAEEPMPANCEIVEADIRAFTGRAATFDLIHARFVLSHLPDRDAVVAMAANMLTPGGHLVITEPYAMDTAGPYPAVTEVMNAYNAYCANSGMDLRWSATVPALVQGPEFGLRVIGVETVAGRLGGGPGVDRWAGLIARVRDDLLAAGLTEGTLAEFERTCAQPEAYAIPQIMLTTIAQKPAAEE